MNQFIRMIIMLLITFNYLILLTGGGDSVQHYELVAIYVIQLWAIPLIAVVFILRIIEKFSGIVGTYIIAVIGLIPAAYVILTSNGGYQIYMLFIAFGGLVWSATWIATAYFYSHRNAIASV